jgi:CRP/FNR family transcriptional regulator
MFPTGDIKWLAEGSKADNGHAECQGYPTGTALMRQGEPVRTVYYIREGRIKLEHSDSDGSTVIAGLLDVGSFVGAGETFLGLPALVTAVTLVTMRTCNFSVGAFRELASNDHSFLFYVCMALSRDSRQQTIHSIELGANACRRLEHFLSHLAAHSGRKASNPVKVRLPLKHMELAQLLAITPTHLARLLRQLEREGVIQRQKGWIMLREGWPSRFDGLRR